MELVSQPRITAFLEIQRAFEEFVQTFEGPKPHAEYEFCDRYNKGQLELADWCLEQVGSISRSTLQWARKTLLTKGMQALGLIKKKDSLIDRTPELQEAIAACLEAGGTDWTPRQIKTVLDTQFDGLPEVSEGQIRRWVTSFARRSPSQYIKFQGKKQYKNKIEPSFGSYSAYLNRPNQLWELDSSPTDIMLSFREPSGEIKVKRFALVGCIDVFSRRAKFLVVPTSRGDAIKLLAKVCILDWGVPEEIKTDNGKDYISNSVERFFYGLGVKTTRCTPGNPKEKPHIERIFKTLQYDSIPLLPGFTGHNVAERDKLRSRNAIDEKSIELNMEVGEFQSWVDDWCKKYHTSKHRGLNGQCPIEKMQIALMCGWEKRIISDPRKLDILMLDAQQRKVQKQGIQFESKFYVHPELGRLIYQDVWIRVDPMNPYEVYVYIDEDLTKFLCKADWKNALSSEELAEVAVRAREKAREQDTNARATRRASKLNQKKAENPASLLNVKGEVKLIEPKKVEHKTEQLDASDVSHDNKLAYTQNYEQIDREAEQLRLRIEAKRQEEQDAIARREADEKRRKVAFCKQILLTKYQGGDLSETQLKVLNWHQTMYRDQNIIPISLAELKAEGLIPESYEFLLPKTG